MSQETRTRYNLHKDFRYLHEPVADSLSDKWVVGRNQFANELADRIVLSRGGAFLVSGLRGVGKTTCVHLAMHAIRDGRKRYAALDGDFELVDVWLNLARPVKPVQLLHHLIRHLYLRLKEMHLLHRLDPELQKDLNTAFLRTSFEISSRSLAGEERGRSSEVGFGKAPWLGIEFLGKISSSYKQTRSDEEALKYLPYDEKAAEFDILNFSRRLLNGIDTPLSFFQRVMQRFGRVYAAPPRIKVVFILDELDKLDHHTAGEKSRSSLDPILQSLKTVFAASSFSFVFIGGKEVEERLLEDVAHGDSIYESIFAYDLYLPCLWDEQDRILDACFELTSPQLRSHANTVALYLRYKGRGVPRRTWRELNKHVRWDFDVPSITLDLEHRRYMQVFAKLEDALQQDDLFRRSGRNVDEVQRDRQRLSFYYTADWIFTRGRDSFSEAELIQTASSLNLGGSLNPAAAEKIAQNTLQLLLSRAFIERADRDLTRISPSDSSNRYKLSPWVLLAFQGSPQQPWRPDETVIIEQKPEIHEVRQIGSYEVIEKIGSGGFSSVYKVRNVTGGVFAAKLLHPELVRSEHAPALFKREAQVLKKLAHPGLVQLHGSGEQDGRPYIIMDLLEGVSLRTLLDSLKTLDVPLSCYIASEMANICAYIHSHDLIRLDIKPANVFITQAGKIKILDLGIIKNIPSPDSTRTATAMTIGTYGYMAPEQVRAEKIDARADIYSLGVVLYEMLTGQTPFPAGSEIDQLVAKVTEEAPSILKLISAPEELASIVSKSLQKDSRNRFSSMNDLRAAVVPFAATTSEPLLAALQSRIVSRESSGQDTVMLSTIAEALPPAAPPPKSAPSTIASAPAPKSARPGWFPSVKGSAKKAPPPTPSPPEPAPQFTPPPPAPAQAASGQVASPAANEPPSMFPPIVGSDLVYIQREKILHNLRNGQAHVQEQAFTDLCALTDELHLVFDFDRNVCLWGGRDAQDRKINLPAPRLILGRAPSVVDLVLDDPAVSRQHIAFFPAPGGGSFIAEDLSSATGTLLNGERLRRKQLANGDVLQVGSRNIFVHLLAKGRTFILSPPADHLTADTRPLTPPGR